MTSAATRQAKVSVGQRYHGWGRTWEVVRVWDREGVAEIVDVIDSHRRGRLPLTQFAELRPAAAQGRESEEQSAAIVKAGYDAEDYPEPTAVTTDRVSAHVLDILTARISDLNAEIDRCSKKVAEWREAERDAARNRQEYSDAVSEARAERSEINEALRWLASA